MRPSYLQAFISPLITLIHSQLKGRAQRSVIELILLLLELWLCTWLNIHHTIYLKRIVSFLFFFPLLSYSSLYFLKWVFWSSRVPIFLFFFFHWGIPGGTNSRRSRVTTSFLPFIISNCRVLPAIECNLGTWVPTSRVGWVIHCNWPSMQTWGSWWVRWFALFSQLEIAFLSKTVLLPIEQRIDSPLESIGHSNCILFMEKQNILILLNPIHFHFALSPLLDQVLQSWICFWISVIPSRESSFTLFAPLFFSYFAPLLSTSLLTPRYRELYLIIINIQSRLTFLRRDVRSILSLN